MYIWVTTISILQMYIFHNIVTEFDLNSSLFEEKKLEMNQ